MDARLAFAKRTGDCIHCGRIAGFISLSFLGHVCSLRCEDAFAEIELVKSMKPETLKEYKEDFTVVQSKLLEKLQKESDLHCKIKKLERYASRLEDLTRLSEQDLEEERQVYFERGKC